MPTLKAAIDASKSRAGADEFVKATQAMTGAAKQTERSINEMRHTLMALAGGQIATGMVRTIASFEQLKATLVTTTGSVEAAGKKFAELQKFAEQTPFSAEEAVKAFNHMKAVGLDPTIESMRAFGDAASMRPDRSFLDFIMAVADGAQGMDKRLLDFGINLQKVGDKVNILYGGKIVSTVKNSAQEIEAALMKVSLDKFGGAMERSAKTLGGQWAQLKDKAAALAMEVGEGGLLDAFKEMVAVFSQTTSEGKSAARELGETLGSAVRGTAAAAKFLAEHISEVKAVLAGVVSYKILSGMGALVTSFRAGTVAAGGFRAAMLGVAASNPFGWIAIGVAGLVTLISKWSEFNSMVEDLANSGDPIKMKVAKAVSSGQRVDEAALAEAIEEIRKKSADGSSEQTILNALTAKGGDLVKDYGAAYLDFGNKAQKAISMTSDEMNEFYKAQSESKKKQEEISNLFLDAVDGLEGGGKSGAVGAARDFLKETEEILAAWQEIPQHIRDAEEGLRYLHGDEVTVVKTSLGGKKQSAGDFISGSKYGSTQQGDLLGEMSKDLGTTGGKSVSDYIYDPEEEAKKAKEFSELWKDELSDVVKAQEKAIKNSPMESFISQYNDMISVSQEWESVVVGGLKSFSATFTEAMWGGEVEWGEFARAIGMDITELMIQMALAAALKGVLTGGGSLGASLMAGFMPAVMHGGGIAGASGPSRMTDPSVFLGAPRYHNGGMVGLRPDEVPAILQRGERIQSRAEVARGSGRDRANVTFVLPGVRDSRGFERNVDQQASRMRRILRGDQE